MQSQGAHEQAKIFARALVSLKEKVVEAEHLLKEGQRDKARAEINFVGPRLVALQGHVDKGSHPRLVPHIEAIMARFQAAKASLETVDDDSTASEGEEKAQDVALESQRKLQEQARLVPQLEGAVKRAEERTLELKRALEKRDAQLEEMKAQVAVLAAGSKGEASTRVAGAAVWALHPHDSLWYQASIESVTRDGTQVNVRFGDGITVPLTPLQVKQQPLDVGRSQAISVLDTKSKSLYERMVSDPTALDTVDKILWSAFFELGVDSACPESFTRVFFSTYEYVATWERVIKTLFSLYPAHREGVVRLLRLWLSLSPKVVRARPMLEEPKFSVAEQVSPVPVDGVSFEGEMTQVVSPLSARMQELGYGHGVELPPAVDQSKIAARDADYLWLANQLKAEAMQDVMEMQERLRKGLPVVRVGPSPTTTAVRASLLPPLGTKGGEVVGAPKARTLPNLPSSEMYSSMEDLHEKMSLGRSSSSSSSSTLRLKLARQSGSAEHTLGSQLLAFLKEQGDTSGLDAEVSKLMESQVKGGGGGRGRRAQLQSVGNAKRMSVSAKRTPLLKLNATDVTQQLVQDESEMFSNIKEHELLNLRFMDAEQGSSFQFMVQRFNSLCSWVVSEVLACSAVEKRAEVVAFFIDVASQCNERRAFNASFALMGGLSHPAVSRLAATWGELPKRALKAHATLAAFWDLSGNYAEYRKVLAEGEAATPYLGLLAKDFFALHSGAPSILAQGEDPLLNFHKLRQIYQQLEHVRAHQASARLVKGKANMEIVSHISSAQALSAEEAEKISRSLEASPLSARRNDEVDGMSAKDRFELTLEKYWVLTSELTLAFLQHPANPEQHLALLGDVCASMAHAEWGVPRSSHKGNPFQIKDAVDWLTTHLHMIRSLDQDEVERGQSNALTILEGMRRVQLIVPTESWSFGKRRTGNAEEISSRDHSTTYRFSDKL